MKSVSFSKGEYDMTLCYNAWSAIQQYKGYFLKVGGGDADELMMDVFNHILTHYVPSKGELVPYMISLARSMRRDANSKCIPCDFLDETLTDELNKQDALKGTSNLVDDILEKMDTTDEKFISVVELALSNMTFFNLMCESLINHDSTTHYFPDHFIKSCLRLTKRCGGTLFNQLCIGLYRKYKQQFNWFMSEGAEFGENWRELDSGFIEKNKSKRVRLCRRGTTISCVNPDLEDWELIGVLGNRRVLKIPYTDLYDKVCDLIDEKGINAIKFQIGSSYICRSLGGSLSICNVSLFRQYEIFELELITNLIYDLSARFLCMGGENIYMLASPDKDGVLKQIKPRVVRGIEIKFDVEDITDICLNGGVVHSD